jgi:general secretion pathway protein L
MTTSEVIKKTQFFIEDTVAKISTWGGPLWKTLSFSIADDRIAPKQCLSVQIEKGGISVAYGSRLFSQMKIQGIRRYLFEDGKYPTPEGLASAVAMAVNDLKAAKAQVLLIIPKAWAIMKTAELPLTVKDNLSDVISFELDRLTPLSSERAFYDFRIITEDEDRLQIMIAAMKSDVLQPYMEALKEKGITASRVVVSVSATGTLSHYVHGKRNTLFVEIQSNGYEGGLVHNGTLKTSFTGNFEQGNEQSTINSLIEEINSLIEMMREKGEVSEVFVNNQVPGKWKTLLQERIPVPVRFIGEMDLKLQLLDRGNVTEVPYTAIGGALESLWHNAKGMNLLDKGIHTPQKTPFAATIVLFSILAALCVFWLISPLQIEEKRIEAIDREIMARRDEVKKAEVLKKDLEGIEKEIHTINSFKSTRPMVLTLLKEMTGVLPKNTWLSRLRITDSTIEIEGYSASATEILPKLEASAYFKKAEFSSPTFRDTRLNADRFIIKMEIETSPEEKVKNEKKE